MKVNADYSEEYNILGIWWGEKGEYDVSEEVNICGREIVIDLNKKKEIIGIEIFDWKDLKEKKE